MAIPRAFRRPLRTGVVVIAAMASGPLAVLPWPSPVAAGGVPPVLTIVSTSGWRETGSISALHVVGEVRNDDPIQTAQTIMIDCRLFNSGGALLQEQTTPADAAVLQPAERSPFDDLFISPPNNYDHSSCSAQSAATVAQPDHNFHATIGSVSSDPLTGAQVITGTVTNLNTVAVANAQLYLTFYKNATDNPLQTIAEDHLWVNYGNPLAAGSQTPFTLDRWQPAWAWNGINGSGADIALLVEAPTPAVSLSPTSISVVQVKTTTSFAQLVSLTNVGTDDLHIGTLSLGGAYPGDWKESDTCQAATITPMGSCSISLTFTPADIGARNATLSIADDANHTPQILTLTGTGTDPHAVISPSPLAFDPQIVNTTSSPRTVTITSSGVGDLHITGVALSGANASDYAITSDGCSNTTVPAGSSCQLKATFHPSAMGARVAALVVTDNALDSPQSASVNGNGVASIVAFDPPSRTLVFPNQRLSSTSSPSNVVITNTGTTTLTVTSVCSNDAEFQIGANACAAGFSLSPGGSKTIQVTFTPSQTGTRVATLMFSDSAPDSPQTVTLAGAGTFGGQYTALPPQRIYDSRNGDGPLGSGLSGSAPRVIQVTGLAGIRAEAIAVVLNVAVTNTTASSYLTVYPTGVTRPTAASLNWTAGETRSNLVEVGIGSGGSVTAFNASGSSDVIFDVAGYVTAEPNTPGPPGFFNPVVPFRLLDTRDGTGAPVGPVSGGQHIDVAVNGVGSLPPSGIAAVVLNVAVTDTTAPSYLTVYPSGSTPPVVANLNFSAGQTIPNRVVVKVGIGGKVSFYNAAGQASVIADVSGWFTDSTTGGTGAGFTPLTPTRILDTRDGTGGVTAPVGQVPTVFTVAGVAGIPASTSATPPKAVVLNVAVTNPTSASYLTLWPDQVSRPTAADLNFIASQTVSNLVVVKVSSSDGRVGVPQGGKIDIFNASGTTDVVIDVVGWYG